MLSVITMFNTDSVDYSGIVSGTRLLTFQAGQVAEQRVNIIIIDDTLIESTESFNVQADSTDNRVTINGNPAGLVVANIIDDDFGELRKINITESQNRPTFNFDCYNYNLMMMMINIILLDI